MISEEVAIAQTSKWIQEVVVGCNFCPFASRVLKQHAVVYTVDFATDKKHQLEKLMLHVQKLDDDPTVETAFIIYPETYRTFDSYLDFVSLAEKLFTQCKYDGIYQLASFHPLYCFAGAPADDAANYTNRSIYPMLHILRESSIDKALENYSNPEKIPGKNIDFARNKGVIYMKMLRDSCM